MFAGKHCQSKRKTKLLLRDDFHLQMITFWLFYPTDLANTKIHSGLVHSAALLGYIP